MILWLHSLLMSSRVLQKHCHETHKDKHQERKQIFVHKYLQLTRNETASDATPEQISEY